jgi:hypothetical protein
MSGLLRICLAGNVDDGKARSSGVSSRLTLRLKTRSSVEKRRRTGPPGRLISRCSPTA